MRYGTGINASQFGVEKSKVKVTVEQSMLEKELSGLVDMCLESISWIFAKLRLITSEAYVQ